MSVNQVKNLNVLSSGRPHLPIGSTRSNRRIDAIWKSKGNEIQKKHYSNNKLVIARAYEEHKEARCDYINVCEKYQKFFDSKILNNENELNDENKILKSEKQKFCDDMELCKISNTRRIAFLEKKINKNFLFNLIIDYRNDNISYVKHVLYKILEFISPLVIYNYNDYLIKCENLITKFNKINEDLLEMKNEILNIHAHANGQWRPREIQWKSKEKKKEPIFLEETQNQERMREEAIPLEDHLEKIQNQEGRTKAATLEKVENQEGIAKESVLERIQDPKVQQTLKDALRIYIKKKNSKNKPGSREEVNSERDIDTHVEEINRKILKKLKSISILDSSLNKKGIIKLSKNLELIVTSNNNYYLSFKNLEMGRGTSKKFNIGLDLTKNRAIALGYVENELTQQGKNEIQKILEKEEDIYCKLMGKDLKKQNVITENKDKIVKNIDCLEFKGSCIFISELCDTDLKNYIVSDEIKNKIELCKEAIDLISELLDRGYFFKDLKPENLLVKEDRSFSDKGAHLCLSDLDIDSFTSSRLPPEILQKDLKKLGNNSWKKDYKEAAVVWALGLILDQIYFNQEKGLISRLCDKGGIAMDLNDIDFCQFLTSGLKDSLKRYFSKKEETSFRKIIQSMLNVDPEKRPSLKIVQQQWQEAIEAMKQEEGYETRLLQIQEETVIASSQIDPSFDLLNQGKVGSQRIHVED